MKTIIFIAAVIVILAVVVVVIGEDIHRIIKQRDREAASSP